MESQGAEAGGHLWDHLAQWCHSRAIQSRVPTPTFRQLLDISKDETPQPLGPHAWALAPAWHRSHEIVEWLGLERTSKII